MFLFAAPLHRNCRGLIMGSVRRKTANTVATKDIFRCLRFPPRHFFVSFYNRTKVLPNDMELNIPGSNLLVHKCCNKYNGVEILSVFDIGGRTRVFVYMKHRVVASVW